MCFCYISRNRYNHLKYGTDADTVDMAPPCLTVDKGCINKEFFLTFAEHLLPFNVLEDTKTLNVALILFIYV